MVVDSIFAGRTLAVDFLVNERHCSFVERNGDVNLEQFCVMDVITHYRGVCQNVLKSP
jgi:hypothetical protein